MRWREEIPRGKLDLLVNVDFRMTTTGLYSDVVLPAATWYEKYDLSMTDMHPFVHSFNQAVPPPWEARTDWDTFHTIARKFSELAAEHLGVRRDVVATPVLHDTPGEITQPRGEVADWRAGECEPVPGRTMPNLTVVERDYGAVADAVGGARPAGRAARRERQERLLDPGPRGRSGWRRATAARSAAPPTGGPSLERAEQAAEAMLALSGVSNGRLALAGFRSLEERCGVPLAGLAEGAEESRITFQDAQVQPRRVITSPEWSGIDEEGRAYAAFTINVEHDKPWHTLSRAHAPLPRPRVDARARRGPARLPAAGRPPADARRRAADRRRRRAGGDAALPDAALEVVDPLRVPGQPAHADAVPRRLGAVDEPAGRRGDRRAATTTGSRRTTATASSSRAWSSRIACRRACA